MAHGTGSSSSQRLIRDYFANCYGNKFLLTGDDAALLDFTGLNAKFLDPTASGTTFLDTKGPGATLLKSTGSATMVPDPAQDGVQKGVSPDAPPLRLAFSTDSYVVRPLFFAGGDIGRLAVAGTVNDVSTAGARPLYLSLGFILEEGFALAELRRICESIAACAREAGVLIVTGDTKVVERGHGDGVYINSTGIGVLPAGYTLSGRNCRPGDIILLSGSLGDHGITIISARAGLSFNSPLTSDVAPLSAMVAAVLAAAPDVRCFRDPTRGGLASTLNELAAQSDTALVVDEAAVPVKDAVRGACDLLGYDVFQVANEGKMVAIVPPNQATAALEAMRQSPYGTQAARIGQVLDGTRDSTTSLENSRAYLQTAFGSLRLLDMLSGEQLPRIC
jgi:hydrogenase expression/formation protein HypE